MTDQPHDPGPPEDYAGEPVPDPWDETKPGVLIPAPAPREIEPVVLSWFDPDDDARGYPHG